MAPAMLTPNGKASVNIWCETNHVGVAVSFTMIQAAAMRSVMINGRAVVAASVNFLRSFMAPSAGRLAQQAAPEPTILDAPRSYEFAALDIPDPETPVGARGIGEPPVGAGMGAVLNALASAVGDNVFRRSPVTADMILTALEAGRPVTEPLTTHI